MSNNLATDQGAAATAQAQAPAVPLDVAGESALDAQRLVTGRGIVLGKSDSGKSNTATVIAEELLNLGIPIAILDPEGEYVSLREEYPVVHFADRPSADVSGGAEELRQLAERAVSESIPVVIDLSEFGQEDQQELAGVFASALFRAQSRYENPLLLFVDECHDFIPERAKPPSAEPLIRVAKRGRKRGLGFLAITQRPADAASAVLTQADWFAWHRLSWNNDVARVKQHLESEYVPEVPNLDAGEMLLARDWEDAIKRVQVRRKTVTDLGSTPSITRSLGTVPDNIPNDLVTETAGDDVQDCTDPLATYRVVKANARNSKLCGLRQRMLEPLDVEPGDKVSLTISDDDVLLVAGDDGIGPYTVCETNGRSEVVLYAAVLDMLDADPGHHIRGFEAEDGVRLENTGARDAPLVGRSEPYCGKTDDDRANSVILRAPVGQYLGVTPDERISVIEEGNEVYVVPGDVDEGQSYKLSGTDKPVITVGARGCSLIDVREGQEVLARPADGRVRLETRGDAK